MKAVVRIQSVYNETLEKGKQDLVIEANEKVYVGALFFGQDEDDVLQDIIEEIEVEGSVLEIMLVAYNLKKKHDMIAKDDKTLQTMLHWQHVNRFSDEIFDTYRYKNDTEYLASL